MHSAPKGFDEGKASTAAARAAKAGQRATSTMLKVKKAAPEVFELAKAGKVTVADAARMTKLPPAKRASARPPRRGELLAEILARHTGRPAAR